jgi:thiol-disulfide isomerase/thioredoxin
MNKTLLFLLLVLYSNLFAQVQHQVIVNLKQEINKNINFSDDLVEFEFIPIKKFDKLNTTVLGKYKGIPVADSLSVYAVTMNSLQFYFDLYKSKNIEKGKFLDFVAFNEIDTLSLSNKPLKQNLMAVIGFIKDKQFIIADANQNEDFSDDIKYEFDADFIKSPETYLKYLNSLTLSNYRYEDFSKGKMHTYNRKFIPYPNSNSIFAQRLSPNEKKYLSFIKLKDYFKGTTILKNKAYDFYVQATNNEYAIVYIKPAKILLSSTDEGYNRQFMHRIKDTINLYGNPIVIDSINPSISKLYLTTLNIKSDNYGYAIGEQLKNYELTDLENNHFKVLDKINQKKYTLIEFWGTWCKPCREFAPEIKKTAETFSANLNVISIALDKNMEKVKEYAEKNEMNWDIAFFDINKDIPMKNELKIQVYPTFILVDVSGKILHRGSIDSFDEILKIISKTK